MPKVRRPTPPYRLPREESAARPPGSGRDRPAVRRRRRRARQLTIGQRRARLIVTLAAFVLVIAVIVNGLGGGGLAGPPPAKIVDGAGPGDPFAYRSAREADFIARATAGNAHVLFSKSPGGALATAARVAAFRPAIDRAVAGTGIDPNLLEGLVFVESAGRPDAIAGSDPADAAGLTQILAATGQSMLGMHIDLVASRRLLKRITAVENGARGRLGPLLAALPAADDRFNTTKALAATVRYLETARRQFGRTDLALESYHMGIGNLHQVLSDYGGGGAAVPYAQLYFDSSPGRHAAAFRLMSGFSDDSVLYYWRVLGAVAVMHLYRTDRGALERLASLQGADDTGGAVLHSRTRPYGDPAALSAAYQRRELVPLPANAAALGIGVAAGMGAGARSVGASPALYRGLRPVALRLLIDMVAEVRRLSGVSAPLTLASTVQDSLYQQREASYFPPSATGFSFEIERRYANGAQAGALQATLDRLQSLNLIAWAREPATIEVTVASDAARWLSSQ